ncbi:hypothetical protein PCE1_000305 [Barthelona sp. PCE]
MSSVVTANEIESYHLSKNRKLNIYEPKEYFTVILFVLLSSSIMALESSILPSIDDIRSHFNASTSSIAVMLTIYTFSGLIFNPLVSSMSDRFGERATLLSYAIIFITGNLLAGFNHTDSLGLFLFFRGLSGTSVASLSLFLSYIHNHLPSGILKRAGLTLVSLSFSWGLSYGYIFEAVLTKYFGTWRLSFVVVGFIQIVCVIVLYFLMHPKNPSLKIKNNKIDAVGIVTLLIGMSGLVTWITIGDQDGYFETTPLIALIVGVIFTILFIIFERKSENPIFPVVLLKDGYNLSLSLTSISLGYTLFSIMQNVPYFLSSPTASPFNGFGMDNTWDLATTLLFTSLLQPVGAPLTSWIALKLRGFTLVLIGIIGLFGVNITLYLSTDTLLTLKIELIIFSFFVGSLMSSIISAIDENTRLLTGLTKEKITARAFSLNMMCRLLASSVAPVVSNAIAIQHTSAGKVTKEGYNNVFLTSAIVTFVGVIVQFIVLACGCAKKPNETKSQNEDLVVVCEEERKMTPSVTEMEEMVNHREEDKVEEKTESVASETSEKSEVVVDEEAVVTEEETEQ